MSEQRPRLGWWGLGGDLGTMSRLVGAEAHLARQKVHLGDSGHVWVQACELHTRRTIAEGERSRAGTGQDAQASSSSRTILTAPN